MKNCRSYRPTRCFKNSNWQIKTAGRICRYQKKTGKGRDFITVNGGEGGLGAEPSSFADHVSLPCIYGFSDLLNY